MGPAALAGALRERAAGIRVAGERVAGRRSRRGRLLGFPWTAPSWPAGLERPLPEPRLGVHYDTSWSRRYPVRVARAAALDWVAKPALWAVASPRVSGLDGLGPLRPPAIFAANHASHVDTPLLLTLLPARFRHRCVVGAGADYFFDAGWKAALWSAAVAAIPIERQRVNRRSADLAAGLLSQGWSLVIFPEGGRSPDGWGQPHRAGGAAYLATRTGVPVVPVHLEGTRAILPRDSKALRRAPVRASFGRPMVVTAGEDARRFAARVEAAIAELADAGRTDWWSARVRAARGQTPPLTGPDASAWRRAWELSRRDAEDRRRQRERPEWPRLAERS
jgi:1-acyl-sn-glycerol-3-phosphate acyltransferase